MDQDYVELRKAVDKATKLARIDVQSNPVVVEVVQGLRMDTDSVITSKRTHTAARTPEILEFLLSQSVQEKLLAPKQRGIILLDVVGYSRHDTAGQAAILALLNESIQSALRHQNLFSTEKTIEQVIPTGDGCYVVFHERLNMRFFRAVCGIKAGLYCRQARIQKQSGQTEQNQMVKITIACHLGEVDFFTDAAGHRNCFGTGMNEAARILDLGKKYVRDTWPEREIAGTVFYSREVTAQAIFVMENLNHAYNREDAQLHDLGLHDDKHGFPHHISWFTGLSNHIALPFHSPNEPEVQPIFFRI